MGLKSPRAKKKSNVAKLKMWGKMFKTPLLILFLMGTTRCDDHESTDGIIRMGIPILNSTSTKNNHIIRHRHNHIPAVNDSYMDARNKEVLSDIKYLRRHLNREIVNFVMSDVLVDGEVETRVHYNGITAKETYVGIDGNGLKLRQMTDGHHFVQIIYSPNGEIQDCEYIMEGKSARKFLKTLRKELKQALEEESYRILQRDTTNIEDEKFFRHFGNVTFRIMRNSEKLPPDIAGWLDYDRLKTQCLHRHEQMKYLVENQNIGGKVSLARSRRSLRENFILPGTMWCGAGQLAEKYNELGVDREEDRCCRAHDLCRLNIGAFRRRFGYFNYRPYTISHCRCDRRFRACLKLADTSVSNMVGKLFFNVVQTQCFILKPVKECTQRSWWGKCLRRGYTRRAYLRNNLPY